MGKINLRERLEKLNFFEEEIPAEKEKLERPDFYETKSIDQTLFSEKDNTDKLVEDGKLTRTENTESSDNEEISSYEPINKFLTEPDKGENLSLRERLEKMKFFEEEIPAEKEKLKRPNLYEKQSIDQLLYSIKVDADKTVEQKRRLENQAENVGIEPVDAEILTQETVVSEPVNNKSVDNKPIEPVAEPLNENEIKSNKQSDEDVDFSIHREMIDEEEYFKDCRVLSDDEVNNILVNEEDDYEITEQDLLRSEEFLKDLK